MARSILIADDNALVRAALRQVLEAEDLGEIVEAQNGKEAILKSQQVKPDLIILDLAMPILDGLTAARLLGKVLPGTPILMHTLYHSPRVHVEAMKVGVRKTIAKSNSAALIEAVRELLPPPSTTLITPELLSEASPTVTGAAPGKAVEEKHAASANEGDLPQAS